MDSLPRKARYEQALLEAARRALAHCRDWDAVYDTAAPARKLKCTRETLAACKVEGRALVGTEPGREVGRRLLRVARRLEALLPLIEEQEEYGDLDGDNGVSPRTAVCRSIRNAWDEATAVAEAWEDAGNE